MISRRAFLHGMALAGLGTSADLRAQSRPRVDGGRLRERLETLSRFGRPAGGTFADGVSRVAYSDADIAGRALRHGRRCVAPAFSRASIRRATSSPAATDRKRAPADPVRIAHRLGPERRQLRRRSRFAVRARRARSARAAGVRTRHPLEMVIWAHEEGFAFGRGLACSRIAPARLQPRDLDEVWNGMRRGDAIRKIGGNPDRILDARRGKGSHHCYLELHIEQGGTLERAGSQSASSRASWRSTVRRDRHRLRQPRRHDADRRAPRRDARGGASDGGSPRRRDAHSRPPGRHGRTHRGDAEFAERHPRAGPSVESSCAICHAQKLVAMMDDIRARARRRSPRTPRRRSSSPRRCRRRRRWRPAMFNAPSSGPARALASATPIAERRRPRRTEHGACSARWA